jgi:hypothetical protein
MGFLANKTALVTGASRGIGRATAQALAKEGAHAWISSFPIQGYRKPQPPPNTASRISRWPVCHQCAQPLFSREGADTAFQRRIVHRSCLVTRCSGCHWQSRPTRDTCNPRLRRHQGSIGHARETLGSGVRTAGHPGQLYLSRSYRYRCVQLHEDGGGS